MMTIDWGLVLGVLCTAGVSFWMGSYYAQARLGLRIQKAINEGSVLPWRGKAYVISPVPHMPDFPGFTRQGGSPTGVDGR